MSLIKTTRAAVLVHQKSPLPIWEITLPDSLDFGQVLVEVMYISIDAANRAWMQGRTYRSQILPGDVMGGYALGKVIDSKSSKFKVGDYVEGDLGWQNYSMSSFLMLRQKFIKKINTT